MSDSSKRHSKFLSLIFIALKNGKIISLRECKSSNLNNMHVFRTISLVGVNNNLKFKGYFLYYFTILFWY